MGLKFRLCRRGDEAKLVSFHWQARRYHSSEDFWRWKYFENPAGSACVSLALDGERVVGRLGFIPLRVRVGRRDVTAALQVDSDILEDYRKSGTYFRLAGMVEKEGQRRALAFGFGFSSAATKKISTAILGFSMVSPVARTVKVIDPAQYLSTSFKIPLIFLPGEQIKRFIHWRANRPTSNGIVVSEISEFGSQFNDLWKKNDSTKIQVVKDATYLNWRYRQCPSVQYKIYTASEKDELKGFIAFQLKLTDGIKHGILSDLFCPPNHPGIMDNLLAAAIKHCLKQGAVSIKCWMPQHHPVYPILVKKGFRPRATKVFLLVTPNANSDIPGHTLQNGANWFYVLGDSDLHLNSFADDSSSPKAQRSS